MACVGLINSRLRFPCLFNGGRWRRDSDWIKDLRIQINPIPMQIMLDEPDVFAAQVDAFLKQPTVAPHPLSPGLP